MATSRSDIKRMCERRAADLLRDRTFWEPVWRDIRDYFCPDVGQALDTDAERRNESGAARHDDKIINTTPVTCVDQLAAGFQSGLTTPWKPWYRLGISGNKTPGHAAKVWLDKVVDVLLQMMTGSDLYNALHNVYRHLTFGTACMVLSESVRKGMAACVLEPGSYAIATDKDGVVDTLFRTYPATVAQIVAEFGIDHVPDTIKTAFDNNKLDDVYEIRNLIEPNDKRIETADTNVGNKRQPWRSVYWMNGASDPVKEGILAVRGFSGNPIIAPRWDLAWGVYGVGPGKKALGDGKQIQKLESEKLRGLAKITNPPLAAPEGLKAADIHSYPGGVTNYAVSGDSGGRTGIAPLYQVQIDLEWTENAIQQTAGRIKTAFFVDLFLALTMAREQQKTNTAYEASALISERMLMAGPVYERLHVELLDRVVTRAYEIADGLGMIPEPPDELSGETINIEYISTLAQTMKAAGLSNISSFIQIAGQFATVSPQVMDMVDFDAALTEVSGMLGVPERIMRPLEQVVMMRKNRQAELEAQQRMEVMQAAAEGAKNLGQAKLQGGTALGALAGEEQT